MTVTEAALQPLMKPAEVLDDLVARLADGASLAVALGKLVAGLGLRSASLAAATGELLVTAGEVLYAVGVPAVTGTAPAVVVPVTGRHGTRLATLTAVGAKPSQLAALRTAAAVLGLSLSRDPGSAPAATSVEAVEQAYDELADAVHDGPMQTLVAARYAADAVLRGGDPLLARDGVQQAVVELRRTLWHLRPRGHDGLGAALSSLSAHLVEGGAPALVMVGLTDRADALCGPAAVTAFRLVQSVAQPGWPAVRVAVRVEAPACVPLLVVLLEGGAPLTTPSRWTWRARALGGDLTCTSGRLRLAFPIPDPRTAP